ncbi:MAG: prepilin-type N-terminal cleavage/methylation domain-containing protein [Planctomycetes bacterium]|nr:prepilin-type N-terminal cleavage/methylation domain-containing protein [Planctomycetota bacterium]
MNGGRRTGRGFTLIELLVVVSIIALLISILLPSLSRAREQAKLVVCQSNISSVGKTFILYLFDLNKLPLYTTTPTSWCSWSFGGWSGTNREHWEGEFGGVWNIETADRPLSVYALKGGTIARAEDTVPDDFGDSRLWPTEETPYYKCPSDRISAQWQWGTFGDLTQQISAYDDVGTSYQLNFHWWDQTAVDDLPENCGICWEYRVGVLGVQLYLGQMSRNPSRFIALMEDPADWGFGAEIQQLGFHGRFSKHVTFFLDGHAAYNLMDTRHLHDSKPNPPGPRHGPCSSVGKWTVVDEQDDHEDSARHLVGDCN